MTKTRSIKMPKLSGLEVLEKIGQQPRTFAIVIFSSSDTEQDRTRARALGCDAYIVKPADFKTLLETVKSLELDFLKTPAPSIEASAPEEDSMMQEESSQLDRSADKMPSINPSESPEIFHSLVQQIKDYAIFLLDTEGYVRSWNEGARRIKGYEEAEIIGKHFAIFYLKQDQDSEKPAFELRMGKEMGRYEVEGWRVRKDGSRFWANVVVTPLRTTDGRLIGYAKIIRDLTQRKLQEEHLQRLLDSEERFRLLVEQVKDYAIFFLDAKGNISSWNQGARRIKGYSADEIIGKHFSIFYPPEDLAADKPAKELSIAIREGAYGEEGWRIKKDGSRFWASVVITALWDKRGNLSGFAKVTRDLSARKQQEEALRVRTSDLEAFAHTLSHDLRAPIRSISSFSQLLKEDEGLPPGERRVFLDKISKAAEAMESLVRDILKLSEVSLLDFRGEPISVESIVEEALVLLESEIKEKKAKIIVSKDLPDVLANRTLMLQVISNLLSNALKFVHPGQAPHIEIYGMQHGAECHIHVKDNGIGIPEENRQTIFDLFNRGTIGRSFTGSGVGLSIVKRALEKLGGDISVASTQGEGSDFLVRLPCHVSAGEPLVT